MADPAPSWPLSTRDGEVRLAVRVQPRASRTGLAGRHGDAVKVALAAPPVDGAANEALVRWFARDVLGVAPGRVRIVQGETSRDKVLGVRDLTIPEVEQALQRAEAAR